MALAGVARAGNIGATMTLDASTAALREPAAASPARFAPFAFLHDDSDAPPRAAAASRLVLFVGIAPSSEVAAALAADGMRCLWLAHAAAALEAARAARFDAAVLGVSTLGELAHLRRALGCPLLVWAAATDEADEADEIVALEQGADAWLPEPLPPRRLRAHLLALLRNHAAPAPTPDEATLQCRWRVDRIHNRLHGAATRRPVALTDAQASLLQRLVDADGRVVPRAQLAEAVPPSHGHALQARSIDVYVHRLRSRLREAGAQGYDIEAVRGRGYRLTEPLPLDDEVAGAEPLA